MFCYRCGVRLPVDAKFCLKCGLRLSNTVGNDSNTDYLMILAKTDPEYYKRITCLCEICNGNDLSKEEEYYVCQTCGTKYIKNNNNSLVPVNKSVVSTDSLNKLYVLARKALSNKEYYEAKYYYGKMLKILPKNWEPVFYVDYLNARFSHSNDEEYRRNIAIIASNVSEYVWLVEDIKETSKQREAIETIVHTLSDYLPLALNYPNYLSLLEVQYSTRKMPKEMAGYIYFDYFIYMSSSIRILLRLGDAIKDAFGDEFRNLVLESWNAGIKLSDIFLNRLEEHGVMLKCHHESYPFYIVEGMKDIDTDRVNYIQKRDLL